MTEKSTVGTAGSDPRREPEPLGALEPQPPKRSSQPGLSRRRRPSRGTIISWAGVIAVILAAVITGVFGLYTNRGDDKPPGETATLVTPKEVTSGGTYDAHANGFTSGEMIRFTWSRNPGDPRTLLNEVKADDKGNAVFRLPFEGSEPGTYLVYAEGVKSGRTASAVVRVLPGPPPTLVGTLAISRSASLAGVTVTVTAVDRYSDWLVLLHLSATNTTDRAVDLNPERFSAITDDNKQYGFHRNNPYGSWPSQIPPDQTITGTIALNHAVDPKVQSLTITFTDIPTPAGFQHLVVKDVRVPTR